MKIALIRHGKTQGNTEGRYIGTTDEALCIAGISEIARLRLAGSYPHVECIYVSPMKRCLQTADIIFNEQPRDVVEGLREQDFGSFENRTYEELKDLPAYRRWVETCGEAEIPQGEAKANFTARTLQAFEYCMRDAAKLDMQCIAIVAHGGTLMEILSAFSNQKRSYFDWQVENGRGFYVEANFSGEDHPVLQVLRKIDCEEME